MPISNKPTKPSKHFCETVELEENEIYNANLHFHGDNPQHRCAQFYSEYNVPPIPIPIPIPASNNNITNHVAGKRYTRKMRRKPYRKYYNKSMHRKRRGSKRR